MEEKHNIREVKPKDPPPLTNVTSKDYVPSHLRKGFNEKRVIKLPPAPPFVY